MIAHLGRRPWALAGFLVVALATLLPAEEKIAGWITQLGGEDFAARERAASDLVQAGDAAVEPLVGCLQAACPEVAWRATAIVTEIAVEADDRTYAKIIAALTRPSGSQTNKLAALATELRTQRTSHRRSLALVKIREFGGRFSGDLVEPPVDVAKVTDVALPEPPPELPPAEVAPPPAIDAIPATPVLIADAYVSPLLANETPVRDSSDSLTIDHNWRGGDAGLTPLRDVPELSVLSLHRAPLTDAALDTIAQLPAIQSLEIEDMSFSAAALTKFRQKQPRTRVVSRKAKAFEVSAER